MKLHRNVFFLENGWRNVGGVMKSFFCNHKKILFEHRLISTNNNRISDLFFIFPNKKFIGFKQADKTSNKQMPTFAHANSSPFYTLKVDFFHNPEGKSKNRLCFRMRLLGRLALCSQMFIGELSRGKNKNTSKAASCQQCLIPRNYEICPACKITILIYALEHGQWHLKYLNASCRMNVLDFSLF